MMNFIIQLVSMSIQASVVIAAVLLLRLLFAKWNISKKYVMLLWLIPFICLILPWKISSPVGFWQNAPSDYGYESLMNSDEEEGTGNHAAGNHELSENVNASDGESNSTGQFGENGGSVAIGDSTVNGDNAPITEGLVNGDDATTNNNSTMGDRSTMLSQILGTVSVIWGIVVAGLGLYSTLSFVKLKKQLSQRILIRDNIYLVDNIPVPMVVGFLRPEIYIPSGIDRCYLEYVIAHEKTHIRRKDTIMKMAAYCVTCIHWFNPLVWLAYNLMIKDMEMACDEETVLSLGQEKKKEYATALLQLATGRRNVLSVPLAFGEGSTKSRILNILKYEKTKQIFAVVALVAGLLLAILFLTKDGNDTGASSSGTEETEMTDRTEDMLGTEDTENTEDTDNIVKEDISWKDLEWMDASLEEWIETNILADKASWFEAYDGSCIQRFAGPDTFGPAAREDIVFYDADSDAEDAFGMMAADMTSYLIGGTSVTRSYKITGMRFADDTLYPIDEDVWLIPYINGYYKYEGVDVVSMEEALQYVTPDEYGMIPYNRQGSESAFAYILMKYNGVYRVQKLEDMINPSEKRPIDIDRNATYIDKELLTWFETEFFNNPDDLMPNAFMGYDLFYESPVEISLYEVFYDGVYGKAKAEITQEELDLLQVRYPGEYNLDIIKIPAADMKETLWKYAGVTWEESQKKGLDKFMYLEEYDAFYLMHGDTRVTPYKMISGWTNGDGTITLRCRRPNTDYQFRVTLRYENGSYHFIAQCMEH